MNASERNWADVTGRVVDPVLELIILGRIPGVGPGRIKSLVTTLGSPAAVRHAGVRSLASAPGIGRRLAEDIFHFYRGAGLPQAEAGARASLGRLEASGARTTHLWEPGYPELLARIYDPPAVLYFQGELLRADASAVAVVGTRRPTPHGMEIAGFFGRELAASGLTVVSGLARGIDTKAHREALRAGGRSVAVVGTGLDRCYPPENRKLAAEISAAGAVISEFEPGTGPEPGNFPRRNRVISGLSLGTIVVESDVNGGAMITAYLALEQNREVFAVPGFVGSPLSRGCHALIREGKAKLVENVDDVIAEIVSQLPPGLRRKEKTAAGPPDLTPGERELLALLGPEPAHVDALTSSSGRPVHHLLADLLGLEMKGLARQLPGKYFIRSL